MSTTRTTKTETLKLAMIGYDPAYYPRAHGANWQTVLRYADAMAEHRRQKRSIAKIWPALAVVKTKQDNWLLLDGYHRWRALRQLGITEFPCTIYLRLPESEWLATATTLNADGKRGLSKYDMVDVTLRLQEAGKKLSAIAELLQLPVTRLQTWLDIGTTKPKDGSKPEALKAPFYPKESEPRRTIAPVGQRPVHSSSCIGILTSLYGVLSDGRLDLDDEDVRAAALAVRDKLLELLPVEATL